MGMRRIALVVVLIALMAGAVSAEQYMWIDRVMESGRLLVPLRGIFEALGAQVGWEDSTQTVTVTAPAMNIAMRINSPSAIVNGVPTQMDVPPRMVAGRTHVPFRFVAEQLGGKVDYQGDRIEMPTVGLTLLFRGEATGPTEEYPTATGQLSITQPTAGSTIGPRIEVYGTAPGGSLLVLETEVRAQDDNELIKVVPGIRHDVPASGNWHFAIAAPVLPANISEPLYYIIKAHYETAGHVSEAVSVKVFR